MLEPEIIYEDKNFLAVNKPAGLLVHQAKLKVKNEKWKVESEKLKIPEPTLVEWLLKNRPQVKDVGDEPEFRPGIVHRLDKATSGVMIIPKTQEYFEYLKSLFQKRQIRKIYLAVVFGKLEPRTGMIKKPIGINSGTLKRSVYSKKMLKDAVTRYRVQKYFEGPFPGKGSMGAPGFSLLEVEPKTGRTHQIRVHLASLGHPIAGDALYGSKKAGNFGQRLMLHALSLEFTDKSGLRIKMEAAAPEKFANFAQEGK